jgi:hypothetical protein
MGLAYDDTPVRDAASGCWTLRIPDVPPSANVTRHMHWSQYSKLMSAWFMMVRCADGFLDISRPTGKRWITIVRYGKRALDRDNVYSAMKPVVDILRPPKDEHGVYGPKCKKAGQPWRKFRIGHGLILEDDETNLELIVRNGELPKGVKPYTTITISDNIIPQSE